MKFKLNVMLSLLYESERLGEGGVIRVSSGVHPPRNSDFTPLTWGCEGEEGGKMLYKMVDDDSGGGGVA